MLKFKGSIIVFFNIIFAIIVISERRLQALEITVPSSVTINLNTVSANIPGSITVSNGSTLQLSSGTITVSNNGNWSNSGTFTPGSSIVQF
ncbi:MAG TPA: hypothetical protein ACFYD7_13820, partial [Candidatus Wujingus californicus]|uniref:hypothetical protein n=1 Tax=Candidatus Wujingus californicus TaxID=3367618 RepID=UPI00402A26B4